MNYIKLQRVSLTPPTPIFSLFDFFFFLQILILFLCLSAISQPDKAKTVPLFIWHNNQSQLETNTGETPQCVLVYIVYFARFIDLFRYLKNRVTELYWKEKISAY